MNIEEFAFILMGMIIMIILYILIGKMMEHKHVPMAQRSGTSCTKQELASSSDYYSEYWPRCSASCTKSASINNCFSMDYCRL